MVSAPIVAESPLSIECRVKEIVKLGTHDMFIADVLCTEAIIRDMADIVHYIDFAENTVSVLPRRCRTDCLQPRHLL